MMQQSVLLKKVVIVDDNHDWFVIKDGRLKEETVKKQVQHFSRMAGLLDYLESIKQSQSIDGLPDYILIDMQLQDMDASRFFDRYEQIMGKEETPEVFILSNPGNKKIRDLAMQYPFVSTCLEKPVPRDLVEVLIAGRSVDNPPHSL